jgi:hypothetical protein
MRLPEVALVGRGASGAFYVSSQHFHAAFNLPQREMLGAFAAQPKVFDRVVFSREAEKFAAIQAHERPGAMRVGTF